jgi:hypothetical protein
VAEDHDLRRVLRAIPKVCRENPAIMFPTMLYDREQDVTQGYNSQDGVLKVSRIRKTIHFVSKTEDDLVWIADACAFGLKRFFSDLPFGDQFGESIHNNSINKSDFMGPAGGGIHWNPRIKN